MNLALWLSREFLAQLIDIDIDTEVESRSLLLRRLYPFEPIVGGQETGLHKIDLDKVNNVGSLL